MAKQKIKLEINGLVGGFSSCILNMREEEDKTVVAGGFNFKEVAEALFKDIPNFHYVHWNSSKNLEENSFTDENKDYGIVYRIGENDTTIPNTILTLKVVKKLESFLVEAEDNDKAVKIAKAFNTLFKVPVIRENFVELFEELENIEEVGQLEALSERVGKLKTMLETLKPQLEALREIRELEALGELGVLEKLGELEKLGKQEVQGELAVLRDQQIEALREIRGLEALRDLKNEQLGALIDQRVGNLGDQQLKRVRQLKAEQVGELEQLKAQRQEERKNLIDQYQRDQRVGNLGDQRVGNLGDQQIGALKELKEQQLGALIELKEQQLDKLIEQGDQQELDGSPSSVIHQSMGGDLDLGFSSRSGFDNSSVFVQSEKISQSRSQHSESSPSGALNLDSSLSKNQIPLLAQHSPVGNIMEYISNPIGETEGGKEANVNKLGLSTSDVDGKTKEPLIASKANNSSPSEGREELKAQALISELTAIKIIAEKEIGDKIKKVNEDKELPKHFMKIAAIAEIIITAAAAATTTEEKNKAIVDAIKKEDTAKDIINAVNVNALYEGVVKGKKKEEDKEFISAAQDICENIYEGKGIAISDEHKEHKEHKEKPEYKKAQQEIARREIELRPDRTYNNVSVFVFNSTKVNINEDGKTKDFVLTGNPVLFNNNGTITFKNLPIEFSLNTIVDDIRERGFEKVMENMIKAEDPYNSFSLNNITINNGSQFLNSTVTGKTVTFSKELSSFFKASREVSRQGILENGLHQGRS